MHLSPSERALFESYLEEAREAAFQGWDFSYIKRYGGNPEAPTPWSYEATVREQMSMVDSVLDMGTGGGEFFATLQPLPPRAYATESYPPNVPLATQRLGPLGVHVVGIEEGTQEGSPLPLEDALFELVINRHAAYDSREVYRILKPGGTFITQQVGYRNDENLRLFLGSLEDQMAFRWNLEASTGFLQRAGFQIVEAREQIGHSRFYDIRALVYLLKVLPWEFPNFDPTAAHDRLLNIYIKMREDGYFDATCHRFFVRALKGA